nr:MAG TPA: hypothetical protein [Caudoviricetes sp.]
MNNHFRKVMNQFHRLGKMILYFIIKVRKGFFRLRLWSISSPVRRVFCILIMFIWYNSLMMHGKPCFLFEKIYEKNVRRKNQN